MRNFAARVDTLVEDDSRPSSGFSYSTKSTYFPSMTSNGSYIVVFLSATKTEPSSNAHTSTGRPSRSLAAS
jgi:hypothetical protein